MDQKTTSFWRARLLLAVAVGLLAAQAWLFVPRMDDEPGPVGFQVAAAVLAILINVCAMFWAWNQRGRGAAIAFVVAMGATLAACVPY